MERPCGLFRVLRSMMWVWILSARMTDADHNQGRLHLTGCQPIEEYIELNNCHCDVGERASFSFNTKMLRGLSGPTPPTHLPLMFDHNLAGCDGTIEYTDSLTTIEFVVSEECGVQMESDATELPMLQTGSFNGRLLQAQLGFHYPNSQGQAEYVIAEVGCACPTTTAEPDDQSPCRFDADQKLHFVKEVDIDCALIKGNQHSDPESCEIKTQSNDCFTVINDDDQLTKSIKFDFALDNDACAGESGIAVKTGLGRYEKIKLSMDVTLKAPMGRMGLTIPYDVKWTDQYLCQKSPFWGEWSNWSSCQGSCGAGRSFRSRLCQNGLAGLPGCEKDSNEVTSVEEVTCQTNVECPEQCPGFTTLGDDTCECDEKPRLTVLVPNRLIPSSSMKAIDNKFIYMVGSEPHVTADLILSEVGNVASVNFLYHTGVFLLPYSPIVSNDNVARIRSALHGGNSLQLTNLSIGDARYEQIVLLRTFVPTDNYILISSDSQGLEDVKIFTSASTTKDYYDEDKYTFNYVINGYFATTLLPFQIKNIMTESDWCRATNEPDMPVETMPGETCEIETACDTFKPYRQKMDCVGSITDECSPKCLEQCDDVDSFPACRKLVNGQIIELDFVAYNCDNCKIHEFSCETAGPADGVQRFLPAEEFANLLMDVSTKNQCSSLLDACKVCDDADLPQWNEWGSCDVKCGLGHRRRERDIFSVDNCKASISQSFEVEDCHGDGYKYATEITTESTFTLRAVHLEDIVKCSNWKCQDSSVTRLFYEIDGSCFYEDTKESCESCCTTDAPTEEDWESTQCVSSAMCLTGKKTIVKNGPCANHPYNDAFERLCVSESDGQCACPSDIDLLNNENHCEHLDELHPQAKCRFFPELNDWRALAFGCKPDSLSGRLCDGFVQCSPPECVDGEAKVNCCESIDAEHINQANGDDCIQVVKFCFDKNGSKIDSTCPDCSVNVCNPTDGGDGNVDPRSLEWCKDLNMVEPCAESMGGELFCDGTLPSCEKQQERVCSITDDSGKLAKCRYNTTCDCDAYHCTDNSITIEGVNQDFLNRLKPRTNDLNKVYGDNLNFYIGGGHPEAFRTEGCFHHYTAGTVDLVYDFGKIENKCGVDVDGSRLNATIWVDSADHSNPTFATATPFAHVICHVTHDVKPLPEKNVTSLMRFKPFEFIKVRKYEHDLSFDISTDPDFHELLEHRQLQNLVLVGDKMYARIRSNEPNDNLKIKVVKCTVKKVNNQDLSLNFIENGCKNDEINEFDFTFGDRGYENGVGSEVRFEWTNFVWRGFTNVEGDLDTQGREEQQYSCDVEICGDNEECTPSCINSNRKRRSPVIPDSQDDEEGVDFELEVFRTEAELKKRYQEILAEHISNSDAIDKLLSNAIVTLAAAMCFISAIIGFLGLYKYFTKDKLDNCLQARIFRRFPPRGAPPKYTVSAKSTFDPQSTLSTADQATIDYAASTVDDFVVGQKPNSSV